jgi:hypothetical protein
MAYRTGKWSQQSCLTQSASALKLPVRFLRRCGAAFLVPAEVERSLWKNHDQDGGVSP